MVQSSKEGDTVASPRTAQSSSEKTPSTTDKLVIQPEVTTFPDSASSLPPFGQSNFQSSGSITRESVPVRQSGTDCWLAEMHYRVAVAYQAALCRKAALKWPEIFDSATNAEENRRTRLHELLLDFVPQQKRLFSKFASTQRELLEELLDRQMGQEIVTDLEVTFRLDGIDSDASWEIGKRYWLW